jgi:hypothetical protein
MSAQSTAGSSTVITDRSTGAARFYEEGLVAGGLGAAVIAAWFLVLDSLNGQPLYTPSILGTALFRGAGAVSVPQEVPVSLEMVLVFTWVHVLVFALLGVAAARLLALAERDPNIGFGLILLLAVFEFGFMVISMVFAEALLQALTVPAILFGNLLAAIAMGGYLWRRHPDLIIRP